MCLPSQPNCLAILTQDSTLFHCLFVPQTKTFGNDVDSSSNDRGDYEDYEEENAAFNRTALLYIYESISLEKNNNKLESVNFLRGNKNFLI